MPLRPPVRADLYQEEMYVIKNRVLVLLDDSWESLTAAEKTLLSKILGAVNLSLDGVQVVSFPTEPLKSIQPLSPKWVIQFTGEKTDSLPFYEVTTQQGYSIIKSHRLSDLDDARKKSLWKALKGIIQG